MSKQSAALAAATAPVVDGAAKAYEQANAVHDRRMEYEAVAEFDQSAAAAAASKSEIGKPGVDKSVEVAYNPRTVQPLLTEKAIKDRLAVLAAFEEYVKKLVAITNGVDSKELQVASASVGKGLTSAGNALIPGASEMQTTVVVGANGSATTTTASAVKDAISSTGQSAISVATEALGEFLIQRKIKKDLPPEIVRMDSAVQTLCGLLESDVDLLKEREKFDVNFMINDQTQFLLAHPSIDAGVRRALIMQLPEIARGRRTADEQLDGLRAAVEKLAVTHHALAEIAKGNDHESLKMKMGGLISAGEGLAQYYAKLSGSAAGGE